MTITLDNQLLTLPKEDMTVEELLQWRNMKTANMAFVLNGKLVKRDNYCHTHFENGDVAMTVTAAFGG